MKFTLPSLLFVGTLSLGSLATLAIASESDANHAGEYSLIEVMGEMQYFSHKLMLAVDAENHDLAHFYAHELEETIEAAEQIESYNDQAIGALTESMLVPAFERLENALDHDFARSSAMIDGLITSCNACHQATGFSFIHVQRRGDNPFPQDFAPRD